MFFRLFLPLIESPVRISACSSDLCPMPAILLQSLFSLAAVPPWVFVVLMAILFVALSVTSVGWRVTARITAFVLAAMIAGVAVGAVITMVVAWVVANPELAAGLVLGFTLGILSGGAAIYGWLSLALSSAASEEDESRNQDFE